MKKDIEENNNSKRINILYYDPTSGYGGSTKALLFWLRELDKNKYNPILVVHYNGPNIVKIRESGIKTIKLPSGPLLGESSLRFIGYVEFFLNFLFFNIPASLYLSMLLKKYDIKIAHLNSSVISVIPGIIASHLAGVPCICYLHNTRKTIRRESFFFKWVDCFICLTEKAEILYKREYPQKRIEIIEYGIDLDEYNFSFDRGELRRKFGIAEDELVVGIAGRLVYGKGFEDFIKAAKILSQQVEKIKFMVVGGSVTEGNTYEICLKKLVRDLELEKRFIFTGWRKDIKEVTAIFDIAVQASSTFKEALSLSILDAMALSKPIVVTDIPGSSEVVVNGKTGIVVPPASPEKLAEAILQLIKNPELANDFGRTGRKRIEDVFNIHLVIKKIEKIYDELTQEK